MFSVFTERFHHGFVPIRAHVKGFGLLIKLIFLEKITSGDLIGSTYSQSVS